MRYIVFLFSIISLLLFHSCSKFDDLDKQLSDGVELSSLAVFNTVPNSIGLEVYLDEEKVNLTNEKLPFGGYLPYRTRFAGKKKVKVISHYRDRKETYEGFVELYGGKVYSLFVNKEKNLNFILSEDDMIKPPPGFAKIRVAHMSVDATSFAFGEEGRKQLFNSVKYKDVTGFRDVKSSESQTFSIRPTATGETPQLEQVFKPKDQGIYTLLIKGYVRWDSEAEAITMQLIEH